MFKSILIAMSALVLVLSSAASFAADHPAQTLIEDSVTAMMELFEKDGERLKSDPDFLKSKVDELVVPNLDFEAMTKLAVGKFWRRADAEERNELVAQFTTLLLNTYTGALAEYSGGSVKFEPFRPESREDRAVVRSSFSETTGSEIPVIYKLREKSGWFIYDIDVNNISLVTSYRSAFNNEIEKGGIEGLIGALKERNNKS